MFITDALGQDPPFTVLTHKKYQRYLVGLTKHLPKIVFARSKYSIDVPVVDPNISQEQIIHTKYNVILTLIKKI